MGRLAGSRRPVRNNRPRRAALSHQVYRVEIAFLLNCTVSAACGADYYRRGSKSARSCRDFTGAGARQRYRFVPLSRTSFLQYEDPDSLRRWGWPYGYGADDPASRADAEEGLPPGDDGRLVEGSRAEGPLRPERAAVSLRAQGHLGPFSVDRSRQRPGEDEQIRKRIRDIHR